MQTLGSRHQEAGGANLLGKEPMLRSIDEVRRDRHIEVKTALFRYDVKTTDAAIAAVY